METKRQDPEKQDHLVIVARAICCPDGCKRVTTDTRYQFRLPCSAITYSAEALAAIGALEAAGYVIVPREPTEAMLAAAIDSSGASDIRSPFWIDGWRAMIDAARS